MQMTITVKLSPSNAEEDFVTAYRSYRLALESHVAAGKIGNPNQISLRWLVMTDGKNFAPYVSTVESPVEAATEQPTQEVHA